MVAMKSVLLTLLALAPLSFAQNLPAFRWIAEVDDSGSDVLVGLGTDVHGNIYLAGNTQSPNFRVKGAAQDHFAGVSDVFVTKLDLSGNVVYSTYFGGSGADAATAMTVDAQGNVYVTGTTTSTDFPTTSNAYSSSVPAPSSNSPVVTFLFKLNADGSVSFATYFSTSQTIPYAIAVDRTGSAYLTGLAYGGLVTTAGAYRTSCACIPPSPPFSFASINDAFLTRFDPSGSKLIFSTYLEQPVVPSALAVAADGSAYVAGAPTRLGGSGVFLLNATGTAMLASAKPQVIAQAAAIAPDGSLYLTGRSVTLPGSFVPTPGAFQSDPGLTADANTTQAAIVKMDAQLGNVLAGTYFGGTFGASARAMAIDPAGNVYIGGYTSPRSLPTRTPFVQGFGRTYTGYVAKLSGDLSSLLFSSAFGDNEGFAVNGVAIGAEGNLVLAGTTASPAQNLWANSLILADPPALRIDAIVNADSRLSDPVSDGETILIEGSGFQAGARLMIGGVAVSPLSITPNVITVTVPSGLAGDTASVQVFVDAAMSNGVLIPLVH